VQKTFAMFAAVLPRSNADATTVQLTTGRLGSNRLPGLGQRLLQITREADPTIQRAVRQHALIDAMARVFRHVVEDRHGVDLNRFSVAVSVVEHVAITESTPVLAHVAYVGNVKAG